MKVNFCFFPTFLPYSLGVLKTKRRRWFSLFHLAMHSKAVSAVHFKLILLCISSRQAEVLLTRNILHILTKSYKLFKRGIDEYRPTFQSYIFGKCCVIKLALSFVKTRTKLGTYLTLFVVLNLFNYFANMINTMLHYICLYYIPMSLFAKLIVIFS